jgi:hypothetical protein
LVELQDDNEIALSSGYNCRAEGLDKLNTCIRFKKSVRKLSREMNALEGYNLTS